MAKARYTVKVPKKKKRKKRKLKRLKRPSFRKILNDLNDPIPMTRREEDQEAKKAEIIVLIMKGHSLLGAIRSIKPLSSASVYEWIAGDEDFAEAVEEGRAYQVSEVEETLFKMATEGAGKGPSIPAIIFFLCNRAPDSWKNTQYQKIGLDKIKDVEWSFKANESKEE